MLEYDGIITETVEEKSKKVTEGSLEGLPAVVAEYLMTHHFKHSVVPKYEREFGVLWFQLPHCNTDWTMEVIDFFKKFLRKFPRCYIRHDPKSGLRIGLQIHI